MLLHQLYLQRAGLDMGRTDIELGSLTAIGNIAQVDVAPDQERTQSELAVPVGDRGIDIGYVIGILNEMLPRYRADWKLHGPSPSLY